MDDIALPKILVCAPTARVKDYCLAEWAEQVRNFDYPNYDVLVVDNSPDDGYLAELYAHGIPAVRIPRENMRPEEFMAVCQNYLRDVVIYEGYTFMFMLETDVFVPSWILNYILPFGHWIHNIPYLVNMEANNFEPSLCAQSLYISKNLPLTTRMVPPALGFEMFRGKVQQFRDYKVAEHELVASGVGCSMIHRDILRQVGFRCKHGRQIAFPDTFWHMDVMNKGIPNHFDTTILATHKHKPQTWMN